MSQSQCTKPFTSGTQFEVEMLKHRTSLWREAHVEVKMVPTTNNAITQTVSFDANGLSQGWFAVHSTICFRDPTHVNAASKNRSLARPNTRQFIRKYLHGNENYHCLFHWSKVVWISQSVDLKYGCTLQKTSLIWLMFGLRRFFPCNKKKVPEVTVAKGMFMCPWIKHETK